MAPLTENQGRRFPSDIARQARAAMPELPVRLYVALVRIIPSKFLARLGTDHINWNIWYTNVL